MIKDITPYSLQKQINRLSKTVCCLGNSSGTSGTPINITYSDLISAISGGTLLTGSQYLLTDFATTHFIVDYDGTQYLSDIIVGVNEPLILTANSVNTLDKEARSALYPQDVIYYDWNPVNWLQDLSFSDLTDDQNPVIITGFKGVIYFRHDTLLDNYMGYDFRNCKFRRWKTAQQIWADDVSYVKGDKVTLGTKIYKSLQDDNENNDPLIETAYWVEILDITVIEYWNNSPSDSHGITSDPLEFSDFKTFAELGTDTYEKTCYSNHFESFKDGYESYYSSGTILSNNVLFLQSEDYYAVIENEIAAGSYGNTINAIYFAYNSIGAGFYSNTIGAYFYSNIIGAGFNGNAIGAYFASNTTGTSFYSNTIGGSFYSNTIEANFNTNTTGVNFNNNTIGAYFYTNTIGVNFNANNIGGSFYSNTIGANFTSNTIEAYFNTNNIEENFNSNNIGASFYNNTIGANSNANNIGANFYSNIIGADFSSNTIGANFSSNTTEENFSTNNIGAGFNGNAIEENFNSNTIGAEFGSNTIGVSFYNNNIGANFYNNTTGAGCNNNDIGADFDSNDIGVDFQMNTIQDNASGSINYTTATHVYATYNTTIFKREDGTAKLSYYNNSDVLTVVLPTA